jgi:glycosyltransferase involved in cell wall biosynthesis
MNRAYPAPALVSAIIPTYNGAAFLGSAIESVLQQTYPTIECIVVDDGSSDDTPSIIAAFEPRVRHARQVNQGPARARNRGARMAHGEFISFLDDDDVWKPTKVERQIDKLAERPSAAVVYTAVEVIDAVGARLAIIPAPSRELAFRNTLLMQWPHLALEQGALIRRTAFNEVGGFDERLSTSDACDLACRLALSYPVEPLDDPLVAYRQHAHQLHHDLSRLERDMRLVYRKVLTADARHRPLMRHARYNLHACLARWYWREQHRPQRAVWHAARAGLARPAHALGRLSTHSPPDLAPPRV